MLLCTPILARSSPSIFVARSRTKRRNPIMLFLGPPASFVHRARKLLSWRAAPVKFHASMTPAINTRPRSETRDRSVAKRKVAMLIAYDGATYHGLQRNTGVETISDVLESSLHRAGAISDENVGFLEKIKWQAAARTDRGVSAAGNLISAKLLFRKDEQEAGDAFEQTSARINAQLPGHVRLLGIKYVTSSFSAKACCEERWYEYMLPLSALRGEKSLGHFQNTLKHFEGSHCFHNYTIGLDHTIPPRPQAMRYITRATCDLEPVHLNMSSRNDSLQSDWVRIRVRGQSFMLHQIRKMISMAVLVHNSEVTEDAIKRSFHREVMINVAPIPAVGLFLDCCHFHWYNERHKDKLPEPLSFHSCHEAREKFKHDYIFPSIARRASEEDSLDVYFRTIERHPIQFS